MEGTSKQKSNQELKLHIGEEQIIIQRRYDALSALNDLLIAIWFLKGSFFFLSDSLVENGTWLFIFGSAQLFVKPVVKLTSLVHLQRIYVNNLKW
ncbi:MAG: hypothetical protein CSA34_03770 [Desulfobulbus propionicus]|nr:MAG: hypothetical protein CSA34_03770 [Desulfobulbus propionicus]